ncbi:ec587532-d39a-4e19-8b3d-fdddee54700c [Thermothielavioides terrestris]|uniref:Ec587532-d39a-4e19-8b3d-fdddee54700c n=1 Tax=Thermothielavioides terrestris TaxID=2587410 RepID=A0A3S4AR67_9PEZI|nr:ec587532-d39a-4e19-8b3d-fdddee54700c [Thermothielavioides terrestris]
MAVVVSPCNPSFPQLRLLGVPEAEEYQLRPLGWENDGDEERLTSATSLRAPTTAIHFFDAVTDGLILIYPPRKAGNVSPDEGCEFAVSVENGIIDAVLRDPDLERYVEFRGSEMEDALEHAVQTQRAEKSIDDPAQSEPAQLKRKTIEHTSQQQAHGRQDLEQRLVQQPPERVQRLLRVRHVLELALGIVDALRHVAREVLEHVGEVVLLRAGLARGRLVLGVGRDPALRVEALDDALGFVEDPPALLDQRPDLPDELLLVALICGRALGLVDFLVVVLVVHAKMMFERLGTTGADGPDAVQALLDTHRHLDGELLVLLLLLALCLLFGALLLCGEVLEESAVADDVALVVDDIPVVVDILSGELADDIAILIDHVALAVDTAAGHGVLLALDLLGLPPLGFAHDVAVLVQDVAVLIDSASEQELAVAADQPADDVSGRRDDGAVLGHRAALEFSKGALLHALPLALGDGVSLAEDVAALAEDIALLVAHAADHLLDVALHNPTEDDPVLIHHVPGLIHALARQHRSVDLRLGLGLGLRFRLPPHRLANDIPDLVQDIAVRIHALALQQADIALYDLPHRLPARRGEDHAVLVDDRLGEALERRGLAQHLLALVLRDDLGAPDHLAVAAPDRAVLVHLPAHQLRELALDHAPDDLAVLRDHIAALVDRAVLEDAEVRLCVSGSAFFWLSSSAASPWEVSGFPADLGAEIRVLRAALRKESRASSVGWFSEARSKAHFAILVSDAVVPALGAFSVWGLSSPAPSRASSPSFSPSTGSGFSSPI